MIIGCGDVAGCVEVGCVGAAGCIVVDPLSFFEFAFERLPI